MKTEIISGYTFDKVAKTVTMTNFTAISIDRLISITDLTNRRQIYYNKLPNLGYQSFANNVVTLAYDTNQDIFDNSDRLLIEYAAYNFPEAVVASAAHTVTDVSGKIENIGARGAAFVINVTNMTGTTPSLTVKLQMYDQTGNVWIDVPGAVTAAITAAGVTMITLYPGIPAVANSQIALPLPRLYRFSWTITGTTPSFTFSIGANYLP